MENKDSVLFGQKDAYVNDKTLFDTYVEDLGLSVDKLKGKKILDLGVWHTGFAKEAEKNGLSVVSLDKQFPTLNQNIPFINGDMTELPFADNTFDLVLSRASFTVIEFNDVEQIKTILNNVNRVLKNGGEFRFGSGPISITPTIDDFKRVEELRLRNDDGEILSGIEKQELEILNKKMSIDLKHSLAFMYEGIYFNEGREDESSKKLVEESKKFLAKYPEMTATKLAEEMKQDTLSLLQEINPNITVFDGSPDFKPFDDYYFVMKKI